MTGQKKSMWAIVSLFLGMMSVFLLIASGYGYQWSWWELMTAFMWLIRGSVLLGIMGFVAAIGYWFSNKNQPAGADRRLAIAGFLLSVMVMGIVGYWFYQTLQYPPIHDISTDVVNPPRFHAIVPLRADSPNDITYPGQKVAKVQHEYYPDIQPLYLQVSYAEAFKRALKAAKSMSWENIEATDKKAGIIEATDTLPWFGFKDDIVIRVDINQANAPVKIDVRSVSRIGKGDIGVNAQRIRDYLNKVRSFD